MSFYDRAYFQCAGVPRGYDDYAALEPGLRRTAGIRLRRMESLVRGGDRRLVDLGCGTGTFLEEAVVRGWRAAGVEVSSYAAGVARERGLDVHQASLEEVRLPARSYDCVTLWDVIEHVRDPVGVLRRAAEALRPGGVLALSTGDVDSLCARFSGPRWHLFNLPEHLFFFTRRALSKALRRVGCRPARFSREINWVPVAYAWERLRKTAGLSWPLPRACRGWLIPATLLDVLGVYAVKVGDPPAGLTVFPENEHRVSCGAARAGGSAPGASFPCTTR